MPYHQAARLAALSAYLDALGVGNIKDLPYGAGRPPADDLQMFAGSTQLNVEYLTGKDSGMFSPSPQPLEHCAASYTMAEALLALIGDPNNAEQCYKRWNNEHYAIQRFDLTNFIVYNHRGPNRERRVVSAQQVATYIAYNRLLYTSEAPYPSPPIGYPEFVTALTQRDQAGEVWAHADLSSGRVMYSENPGELPNEGSWRVTPDIIEQLVPDGPAYSQCNCAKARRGEPEGQEIRTLPDR
ncbi:polyprotein [Mycena indigotica]|uniref:Polyprotein n=1 Tax=Mycena indigotica TaxID=2126181 RepID=A0A8H6T4W7_9AGAR|nr:polyprotein [Mycena indigotica]KAF7311803.1 polyprotein [Mycena indigotica]